MKLEKKKTSWSGLKTAILACALVGAGMSQTAPARAADNNITVGILDESRLGEGYTKYRGEVDALNKRAADLDAQLDAREVMNDADGKRFDALIFKKPRTTAEDNELQSLIKTGTERRKDRDSLVAQAARTPDQEARLKAMQDNMKANAAVVRRLEDELFQGLKADEEETDKKYIGIANEMVQKLAQEKKLSVVFRKGAVVWFAPAIDLTDEVLARLNR
jgi:Skp family chaperone for outer membrane proteins